MSYIEKWKAISARVSGLERVTLLHAQCLVGQRDSPGERRTRFLNKYCDRIIVDIGRFKQDFGLSLPNSALSFTIGFLEELQSELLTSKFNLENTYEKLVRLPAFAAELTFLLSDTQEHIRSRAEIAFAHLQSLIQVDDVARKDWGAAYERHETHCEARGKVHLLWHGILAFKVDGAGERTDLVYPEPPNETWQKSAIGLVLTEWKSADAKDAASAFELARAQAKRYVDGPLAGIELASYRYAIVVTEKAVSIPLDHNEGGVTYRHINIAVNPDSPAIDARKAASRRRREA